MLECDMKQRLDCTTDRVYAKEWLLPTFIEAAPRSATDTEVAFGSTTGRTVLARQP